MALPNWRADSSYPSGAAARRDRRAQSSHRFCAVSRRHRRAVEQSPVTGAGPSRGDTVEHRPVNDPTRGDRRAESTHRFGAIVLRDWRAIPVIRPAPSRGDIGPVTGPGPSHGATVEQTSSHRLPIRRRLTASGLRDRRAVKQSPVTGAVPSRGDTVEHRPA